MRDREGIRLNYLERVQELKREWSETPTNPDVYSEISELSEKSLLSAACSCDPFPSQADAFSEHLLSRLQAGSRWLTAQHQTWLIDLHERNWLHQLAALVFDRKAKH